MQTSERAVRFRECPMGEGAQSGLFTARRSARAVRKAASGWCELTGATQPAQLNQSVCGGRLSRSENETHASTHATRGIIAAFVRHASPPRGRCNTGSNRNDSNPRIWQRAWRYRPSGACYIGRFRRCSKQSRSRALPVPARPRSFRSLILACTSHCEPLPNAADSNVIATASGGDDVEQGFIR